MPYMYVEDLPQDIEKGKPTVTLVGTDGYVKNVIDKTPGSLDYNQDLIIYGKEFINKYRKK